MMNMYNVLLYIVAVLSWVQRYDNISKGVSVAHGKNVDKVKLQTVTNQNVTKIWLISPMEFFLQGHGKATERGRLSLKDGYN